MQQALEADIDASPNAIGHMALIRAGDEEWRGATGSSDPDTQTPIDSTMSFRMASVTKTFVAAATYRLIESGEFTSDSAIDTLLTDELREILENAGYEPSAITVDQLLTHTSGVIDFTFGPGGYVSKILANPQHRWTRAEQVALISESEPFGTPGDQYHYSDTGYALLGAIIEQATGSDMGTALRDLLDFEGLGLQHTYLESIDPIPSDQPPRVHQFLSTVDTYDFDPSMDLYGGGGLVTTLDDLARFFEALLDDRVFDDPRTLEAMTDVPEINAEVQIPGDPRPYAAASGLFRLEIAGSECWSHKGFWGVDVTVCPAKGITVATSVSQASNPASLVVLVPYVEQLLATNS